MDDKREVIELVNKLQGYMSTTGRDVKIELPQIVVVGAQSSGKSSVLDGLVGASILPRGTGTVTKCPIIVQLNTIPDVDAEEFEFPNAPELGRIKDNNDVRKKIKELMEINGGAIKDEPIIVKVFSPKVVTLTVVDLPGIKKLPESGEPDNVGELTSALSRKYIGEKNAIILAVSTANSEMCNSDGMVLAKEADPNGDRSIGVLTKLDLMDEGTNARDLLTGTSKDVCVKLGMVGVVNRSQKDIDDNLSVEQQLRKENEFLNKTYPDLADQNGVPYLRKRLQDLLVQHILKCLPEIQNNVEDLLKQCQQRLHAIPDVIKTEDKRRFASMKIEGFRNSMKKEIEGSNRDPDFEHTYGGVKIKETFERKFAKDMELSGKMTDDYITDDMILKGFKNSGAFDSVFVYSEGVFRKLALEKVKHLDEPALKCAERVHDEILKIADRYLNEQHNGFSLFPEFKEAIKSVVHSMLYGKLDEVNQQIKDYIQIQASEVISLDKVFLEKVSRLRRKLEKNLNGDDADSDSNGEREQDESCNGSVVTGMLPNVPTTRPSSDLNDRKFSFSSQRLFSKLKNPSTTKLIKEMVNIYFLHIRMQVQDYIPKLVANRLITQFSSHDGNLGHELGVHVMDKYEELVKLPTDVSERRTQEIALKEHLREIISEIKGIISAHKYKDESGYSDQGNASSDEDY